jgi:hypothetical protein
LPPERGDGPGLQPSAGAILCLDGALRENAILTLLGIEPLQYEPVGRILVRRGKHFCLISTRCGISELQNDRNVRHIRLTGLDPGDAIELLKAYGVRAEHKGQEGLLRNLAKQWNYHPLSLVLLGSYLANYCEGDVRAADTIRELHGVPGPYRTELMLKAHERRLSETNKPGLQLLRDAHAPLSTLSPQTASSSEGTYLRSLFSRTQSLSTVEFSYSSGARQSVATICSNALAPAGGTAKDRGVLIQLGLPRRFGTESLTFCRPNAMAMGCLG